MGIQWLISTRRILAFGVRVNSLKINICYENRIFNRHVFESADKKQTGRITFGYFSDVQNRYLSQIVGLKHILDRAILGSFHQLFHLVRVFLAHLTKTDASQNCWRLLSAVFRRASFNHQNRITLRKTKASQFLWNQKWFQVTYYSIRWNLSGFTDFSWFWWYFFFCDLVSWT